jgi:multiple antibiotic resistance protein
MNADLGAFALLCFTSLLAITNPLSAAPMYLALTAGYSPGQRRRTLRHAILTAFCVMVAFALVGGAILRVFGITLDAFRIAGGVIFFGMGMDMLQARRTRGKTTEEEEREGMTRTEVGITPLGIPMITGPGTITTVMVLMTRADTLVQQSIVFGTMLLVMLISWLVLALSPTLIRAVGQTGLNVMTRIMGLLVTVIAVQFIVDGARPILVSVIRAASR